MSQSFPSSTGWEPFGSSQQQHALGWRRPATKPALPAPPNPTAPRFPTVSPWNHINRPSRTDPPSLSQPTPSPHDEAAFSTALKKHEQEQETRTLQRYNALKTDLAAVDAKITDMQSGVHEIRDKWHEGEERITAELRRVRDECRRLKDDIRGEAAARRDDVRIREAGFRRLEERIDRLEKTLQAGFAETVQNKVLGAVEDVVQRVLNTTTHRLTRLVTDAIDGLKTTIRTHQMPPTTVKPVKVKKTASATERRPSMNDKQANVSFHHDSCTQEECPLQQKQAEPAIPAALQIHSSDEEYALQVANRKRPPIPSSGASSEDADSLDPRHMHTSDASTQDPGEVHDIEEPPQRLRRCAKRQKQDSAMSLFEDSESSDSLTPSRTRSYPEDSSYSPTKSSWESPWLPRKRRRGSRKKAKKSHG